MDRAVHTLPRHGALTAVLDPPADRPARVRTGPLTFGQLFAWREAELLPAAERDQPNLLLAFALHGKASVPAMRSAFARLRAHHETLRTTFAPGGAGREPLQLVHPPDSAGRYLTEVAVPPGEDAAAFAARLGADLQRRPFDLVDEEPWRACVVVDAGLASHLVIVVHHIALDEWSVNLLIADFDTLLAGGTPDPPVSQLALAHAQRHDPWWRANQTGAERHLRATLTAATEGTPSAGGAESPHTVPVATEQVVLRSRTTLPAAAALARALAVPLPSIVLAACCRALHRHTGAATLLINTMCANRLYPDAATLAGTMSQWAPLVSTHSDGEPPDQFIHRVHRAALRAGQHGCHDVDLRARVHAEAASTAGPAHELYFVNYVQAGGPGPSFDIPDWELERQPIRYYGGPPLYLQARQEADYLELTARSRVTAMNPAALEALLTEIHALLLAHVGNQRDCHRIAATP